MRTEVIVCQRCCLCIPLRYGLIVWGYVRLALAGLLLFGMSYSLNRFVYHSRPGSTTNIVIASLVIILVIADIILSTIFIIGCHTKNVTLIKQYYYHNLLLLALLVPFCLYVFGLSLFFMFKYRIPFSRLVVYMLSDLIGSLTYVVIQIYVTLLVRSQFIKMKSGCQFRFENKVAEAECSLNIEVMNVEKNIDDTKARETNDYDEIRNYV